MANEVARLIEARASSTIEWVEDELLGRQLRSIQVTAGQTVAADVQFLPATPIGVNCLLPSRT